jgi:hypothetical protein
MALNNNAGSSPINVTDQQVSDFLLATNPCLANLPATMREGIRESLQQRVDAGELSAADLSGFSATASAMRCLGD